MTIDTVEIIINGIVQGVGFRPFLYKIAKSLELKGFIYNDGNLGIKLIIQGLNKKILDFLEQIKKKQPKYSYIEDINQKKIKTNKIYEKLEIIKSQNSQGISLTLPPDISICQNCINGFRDARLKKYYFYPFIACAICGPRFTTVKNLPYDRENSTMSEFPLCKSCNEEYLDFNNRRFHAQTFSCSKCGPNYSFYLKNKEISKFNSMKDIFIETVKRIKDGQIAAIKGIGGTHLVCLADNDDIIIKLRNKKKNRKNKPFALMIPNIKIIENDFKISLKEKELLESFRRPIILLEKKKKELSLNLSRWIAPGLNNIGFMLPYSGIHHILFDLIGNIPLVYTSGNLSNIPMSIENEKIFNQLKGLADFFLLHNRTIFQRADDSVLRVHMNKIKLIRRSRGYIPEYITLPFKNDISGAIATGPELSVSGAILRFNRIFPTQYIGNITNLETFNFYKDALFHMKNLLQISDQDLKYIVCDVHPSFFTTKYAQDLSKQFTIPLYQIQHHYSHILSLMIENKIKLDEKIIGISTDGIGFGDDGNIWGGEILLCSYRNYKRLGHLEYQPMIGGDRCTKYPARMVASIILKNYDINEAKKIFQELNLEEDLEYKDVELEVILKQFENDNNPFLSDNIPLTSSTGRILDTISYLLNACKFKTYRGEPAMRLEGLASRGNPNNIALSVDYSNNNGSYVINTSKLTKDILDLIKNKNNLKNDIAAKCQIELANSFANIAIINAEKYGIENIGLSGGVAYNYLFSQTIKKNILESGFSFIEHNLIPPGDGGISIGQLVGGLFKHSVL